MAAFNGFYLRGYINATLESGATRRIGAALALGIILGFAVLALDPPLILSGTMGIILLVAAFTNPEIVILVVLAFVSGLIPTRFNFPNRLPIGTFHVSDLLLIWLLSVVVIRLLAGKGFSYVTTPLDKPVLLFFAAVLVAIGTSIFRFGIGFDLAQIEARRLMYYLIFFVVTNLIRTRLQLIRLVRGMLSIGLLVAGTAIIQGGLGGSVSLIDESFLRGGRLVSLKFHPGLPAVYIVLVVLTCDLALRKNRQLELLRALQVLVLFLGFFLSFERSFFISYAIILTALFLILRQSQLSRLVASLLLVTWIAVGVVGVLGLSGYSSLVLDYSTGILARIASIFSDTILTSGETLVSRWVEVQYAWARIVENPALGIGLWNPYRPPLYERDTITHYVHNAYVSIWLKTGLLGLIPFLWLCVRFLQRGFQHWREEGDGFLRAVVLGFTLAYLGMMINNLTAPYFVQDWSLAIFGVILGINELILMHSKAATAKHWKGAQYGRERTTAAG